MSDLIRKAAVPSDAYRNPVLENVSIAAYQDATDFVARAVFPTVPSDDQAGYYYEIDTNGIAADKAASRAPGGTAREGTWDLSKTAFLCVQYGYREKLPEELVKSAGAAANAEAISAAAVAEVMMISAEARFAAAYFVTSKWARDIAGAATNVADTSYIYWSTGATSTPINDIYNERIIMKKAGKRFPNTMVIGAAVLPILLTHPTIVARLVNGQRPGAAAMATLDDLAKIFMMDRVLVANAVKNTANEPATASNSFILDSKSIWMGYVNPTPAVQQPSAGYRFAWSGIAGNSMGVRNWKYWDQPSRSTYVEGACDDTYKLVSSKLGTFFPGIIA